MTATTGEAFELAVDEGGRITQVAGPWPDEDGAEFELGGSVPRHVTIDAPAHIKDFAAARGRYVCYYDPDDCQTCFCDESGDTLYCRKMC
jgi:hypothetical protein